MFEPPRPVMVDVVAPEVTPRMDPFLMEDLVEPPQGTDPFVFPGALPDANDDLTLIVEQYIGVIGRKVREKTLRGIVIERAVHPSAEEIVGVVDARKGDRTVKKIGAAQEAEQCMVGAHTAAGSHRCGRVDGTHPGDHLIRDKMKILFLPPGAVALVSIGIRPTLFINGIRGKKHP